MNDARDSAGVRLVRLAGIVGLLAAAINAVADVMFQGVGSGAYPPDMTFMWEIPDGRLRSGAFLGALVIPFAIVGYWHVYRGIRRAGRILAAVPVLVGSYAAAVGSGFHFALLHPALLGKAIPGASVESTPVLEQLHADMVTANTQLSWVLAGFAVFSLWWMVLVFIGRTDYPRWFGVLNPMVLMIGLNFLLPVIPSVGAYLFPAASALSYAVFFAFSVKFLWNCD